MKRIFNLGFCLSIIFAMQSCATMSLSELRPTGRISTPLPYLEPDIDVYSIESVYSLETTSRSSDWSVSVSASIGDSDTDDFGQPYLYFDSPSYVRRYDNRVQDAITILSREISDNISSPTGETRGAISCRIAAGIAESKGWTLMFLSTFCLFIPSFLGMPAGFYATELEVDCDIYNIQGDCIGSYSAIGKSRVPIAMYYGYTSNSAARKSAAVALKKAMQEIKVQIERDSEKLNRLLR